MKEAAAPITIQAASQTKQRNFTARSTSVEAQRHRIIAALRQRPQTTHDLRCLGIYQAPARIKELRDKLGFSIRTEPVTLYDRDGFLHPNAARYHLESEPVEGYVPASTETGVAGALRRAAKAMRAQAKGFDRNSIAPEHLHLVKERLVEALRLLSAIEKNSSGSKT